MGPILFRWVACEVSLVSLVEVIFCSTAFYILMIDSQYDSNVSIASQYDFNHSY